jgi:sarcosine oxidase subunit beta
MDTAEVVIVGGGVVGASIAYALAQARAGRTVLFERTSLASGATGICPGGIRQQFEDEADCRLARRSAWFFTHINDLLTPPLPFRFERTGYLFLAFTEETLDRLRRAVKTQNSVGIESHLVTPAGAADIVRALRVDGLLGGAYSAADGFLEDCHGVTAALAARAREAGLEIRYEEVVRIGRYGGRWLVETGGSLVDTPSVVLAAAADTTALVARLGLMLPIVAERRRLAYTTPAPRGWLDPLVVAGDRGFAGKQLANGVFYFGWLGETSRDDDLTFIEQGLSAGDSLLRGFAELRVRRVVTGVYDLTPDRRPILGGIPGFDGLYVAAGFSGHGFMLAPAAGEVVAAAVLGHDPPVPADPFSAARFAGPTPVEGLHI